MKPSHEIEKIRDEEFDETLQEFFDEDRYYTKYQLEQLLSKYRTTILPHTKSFHGQVTAFFNVIEELQKKHEISVKSMKRRSKPTTKNNIGDVFKDGFLHKDTGLLLTYKKYFAALNKLMPSLKMRSSSSKDLFQSILVFNHEQRDNETLLSLMYRPMKRLLSLIHTLEEFIFLLTGMSPSEVHKLVTTKNELVKCFLNGPRMPASMTPQSSPSTSTASLLSPPSSKVPPPTRKLLGKRGPPSSEVKTPPKASSRLRISPAKVPRINIHQVPDDPKKRAPSAIRKPTNSHNLAVPLKPKKR